MFDCRGAEKSSVSTKKSAPQRKVLRTTLGVAMSVRPNGIEVVENNHLQGDGGARSISFRTKPPVVTFYAALLCVALGYSGFMNLLHGMHWGIAALQFALALVAAYIVVRALFNRTFVRVASGVFTVSERPIPWPFKKRSLPVNEIVSIAAAERRSFQSTPHCVRDDLLRIRVHHGRFV
jgi:hypothetical protein